MILVFSFLLFILACFFTLYIPGEWVLRKVGYKNTNAISVLTLSLGVGVSLFLIGNYILVWLRLSYIYLIALLPILFFELPVFIKELRKNFTLAWVFSFDSLIILLGVMLMASATVGSGVMKNGNLVFYGINALDGIFHSALIGNLTFQFPPSFPGLSHTMLHGYHILYDFMLSQFALLFGFSAYDLYFRFFSIFTALFYGLSGITLSYSLKMNTVMRRVFLFLLYFAQGGEYYFFHWFHNGERVYNSGIVQPAGNIVDPSVLLSISYVFLLFVVFFNFQKAKQIVLPILFLGVLPGIKIYAGILAYATVGIMTLIFVLRRKTAYLYVCLLAGVISAAFYLPFNVGAGSLIFHPFLFFTHFMESDKLFVSFQWPLKLQVYELHHNSARILYLYGIALVLYFIPPLGIRLVSLTKTRKLFSKTFYTPEHLFWCIFTFLGAIIPILFIQSIAVFNTVQFFWLIWIVLIIPTTFSLTSLLRKPSSVKSFLLFLCIIIFSLPVLAFPLSIMQGSGLVVDKNLSAIAQYMQRHVSRREDVLVVNRQYDNGKFSDIYTIPLLAALSGRPMYYEPEQAEFSKIEPIEKTRKKIIDTVRFTMNNCQSSTNSELVSLLRQAHTNYILLLEKNDCITKLPSFKKVIQKDKYSLFLLQ